MSWFESTYRGTTETIDFLVNVSLKGSMPEIDKLMYLLFGNMVHVAYCSCVFLNHMLQMFNTK